MMKYLMNYAWHRRPDVRLMAICLGLVMACGLLLSACRQQEKPQKPKSVFPVSAAIAVERDVPVLLRAIGNVEASSSVELKSQVNGQLSTVHFTEGQEVAKGDLLFSLDPQHYQAAVMQAEAALARDLAQEGFARDKAVRYADLLQRGVVSQQEYDQLQTNASALAKQVMADRAILQAAQVDLAYCTIKAPMSGRTGNLAVHAGSVVKANEAPGLVTINQISPLHVAFSLPERYLQEIQTRIASAPLTVSVRTTGNDSQNETGTVSFLDNTVDTGTGTIKVKALFDNKSKKLWPGQFVNVTLSLKTLANAVVVPTEAVQIGQEGPYVFVIKADSTVESRPVAIGPAHENETVIVEGLQSGEQVVTEGQMRLRTGVQVAIAGEPQESKGSRP